jgi:hypothetical protein
MCPDFHCLNVLKYWPFLRLNDDLCFKLRRPASIRCDRLQGVASEHSGLGWRRQIKGRTAAERPRVAINVGDITKITFKRSPRSSERLSTPTWHLPVWGALPDSVPESDGFESVRFLPWRGEMVILRARPYLLYSPREIWFVHCLLESAQTHLQQLGNLVIRQFSIGNQRQGCLKLQASHSASLHVRPPGIPVSEILHGQYGLVMPQIPRTARRPPLLE